MILMILDTKKKRAAFEAVVCCICFISTAAYFISGSIFEALITLAAGILFGISLYKNTRK
jgi:hypothetical protein